jgi:hypothetical protein
VKQNSQLKVESSCKMMKSEIIENLDTSDQSQVSKDWTSKLVVESGAIVTTCLHGIGNLQVQVWTCVKNKAKVFWPSANYSNVDGVGASFFYGTNGEN